MGSIRARGGPPLQYLYGDLPEWTRFQPIQYKSRPIGTRSLRVAVRGLREPLRALGRRHVALSPAEMEAMVERNKRLETALGYVERGLALLPLRTGSKDPNYPLLPKVQGRGVWKPLAKQAASADQVQRWFEQDPEANIGIVCGGVSGNLVVVDFDAGIPSGLHLPPTAVAETSRGRHYYYRSSVPFRTFAWVLDGCKGEVRCDGGYVVAPPSIHPTGAQYRWAEGLSLEDAGIAELPADLLDRLSQCRLSESRQGTRVRGTERVSGGGAGHVPVPSGAEFLDSPCTPSPCNYQDVLVVTPQGEKHQSTGDYGELASLAADAEVVRAVLAQAGISTKELNQSFLCPLPGHDATSGKTSACLFQTDNGLILLQCFHEYQSYAPVDLYYWRTALGGVGHPQRLSRGSRVLWWQRALVDAKIIAPRTISAPALSDDAPACAKMLYEGFVELLCLQVAEENAAPFSWDFAMRWCGIGSLATVSKGMKWLLERGYLQKLDEVEWQGGKGKRQANRFALGDPAIIAARSAKVRPRAA